MRYIVASILFISCYGYAIAQKLEFGLNVGVVKNSLPSDFTSDPIFGPSRGLINPTGNIKGMLNLHHWQLGMSVGAMRLSYKMYDPREAYFNGANINYNIPPASYAGNGYKVLLANPAVGFRLFFNRIVAVKRFKLYGGTGLGYLDIINKKQFNDDKTFRDNTGGVGFSAGLQVGATYYASKHIGFNAEVAGDYLQLGVMPNSVGKFVSVFPFTAGIRYRP